VQPRGRGRTEVTARTWCRGLALALLATAGACGPAQSALTTERATTTPPTTASASAALGASGPVVTASIALAPWTLEHFVVGDVDPEPLSYAGPSRLPPVVLPAWRNEGTWILMASTTAGPAIWATSLRPFREQPAVVASFAVFDQYRLHAALFNGSQTPGGGPWVNGPTVTRAALAALVATFNGGFLFKDIKGGYLTEGRVVKPLLKGEATIGIDANGRMAMGVYGVDLTNDGRWVSLRQNLPLIVDGGVDVVNAAREPGVTSVYWGADVHNVKLDLRSALCQRPDGLLMYAVVGKVDIHGLARAIVAAGCRRGMELDMNGNWPQFSTLHAVPGRVGHPLALDGRMNDLNRFLTAGSRKDFFALFDPAVLGPGLVR